MKSERIKRHRLFLMMLNNDPGARREKPGPDKPLERRHGHHKNRAPPILGQIRRRQKNQIKKKIRIQPGPKQTQGAAQHITRSDHGFVFGAHNLDIALDQAQSFPALLDKNDKTRPTGDRLQTHRPGAGIKVEKMTGHHLGPDSVKKRLTDARENGPQ